MLKKRIVASLIVKNGRVVQSIGFKKYLPVGDVGVSVEFLNKWGIDEIVLLDIDATRQKRGPDFKLVMKISQKSFAPLTVGGGIRSIDDIRKLIRYGADKISINKISLLDSSIIKKAAEIFGSQCIVVSADVKKKNRRYEIFSDNGKVPTGLDAVKWAKKIEGLGAGEIFLNSIDRDGLKSGYDLKIIKQVADSISIPIIACGGAGHPKHFLEAFTKAGASAAAAGNFFHFTEHSPIIVKSYLLQNKVDVRLDSYTNYKDINFIKENGRIAKRSDNYLDKIRFEYLPEEII